MRVRVRAYLGVRGAGDCEIICFFEISVTLMILIMRPLSLLKYILMHSINANLYIYFFKRCIILRLKTHVLYNFISVRMLAFQCMLFVYISIVIFVCYLYMDIIRDTLNTHVNLFHYEISLLTQIKKSYRLNKCVSRCFYIS